ncbi:MAG: T9SS type A sorting domain-containing protein [Prevotellaceae bacterium]|nr:T9SS type A sorting domain-containing protein [Candidatus Colivivens equi]
MIPDSGYRWYRFSETNTTPILLDNDNDSLIVVEEGVYFCEVYECAYSTFSNPPSPLSSEKDTVIFFPQININTLSTISETLCGQDSIQLTIDSYSGSSISTWYIQTRQMAGNPWTSINTEGVSPNNQYYILPNYGTHEYRIFAISNNQGCTGTDSSNIITISVLDPIKPASLVLNTIQCGDTIATIFISQPPYYDTCSSLADNIINQWQHLDDSLMNWINIENEHADTLNVTQNGQYRLWNYLPQGDDTLSEYSNTIQVELRQKPVIGNIIISDTGTFCYGAQITLSLTNYNEGMTYQWISMNGDSIPESEDASYTFNAISTDSLYAIVTNPQSCSDTSEHVVITVYPRLRKAQIALSGNDCDTIRRILLNGSPFYSDCTADSNLIAYQWQRLDDTLFVDIPNSQSNSYYVSESGSYRLKTSLRETTNVEYSDTLVIDIYKPVYAGQIGTEAQLFGPICYNTSVDIIFTDSTAYGSGEYQFQWIKQHSNDTIIQVLSTDSNHLTENFVESSIIRVIVSDECSSDTTAPLLIEVLDRLHLTAISVDPITCGIDTALVRITQKAFANNCTADSAQIINLLQKQSNDDTNTWTVIDTISHDINSCTSYVREPGIYRMVSVVDDDSVISEPIAIVFKEPVDAGTLSSTSICYNSSTTLYFEDSPTGGNGTNYTFHWYKIDSDSQRIATQDTTATCVTDSLTESTKYRVIVTSDNGCSDSTEANITVYPRLISASIQIDDSNAVIQESRYLICGSNSCHFVRSSAPYHQGCNSEAGRIINQWQTFNMDSMFTDIPGANDTTFTINTNGRYRLKNYIVNGDEISDSVFSEPIEIFIYQPIISGNLNAIDTICFNTEVEIDFSNTPAGGNGVFSYLWQSRNLGQTIWNDLAADTSIFKDTLLESKEYRVIVTSNEGCNFQDTTDAIRVILYDRLIPATIGGHSEIGENNTMVILPPCGDTSVELYMLHRPYQDICSKDSALIQYQWQHYDSLRAEWHVISSDIYCTANQNGLYRLKCSLESIEAISDSLRVLFRSEVIPGRISTRANEYCYNTIIEDTSIFYFVEQPSNGNNFSYSWQYKIDNSDIIEINNATTDTCQYIWRADSSAHNLMYEMYYFRAIVTSDNNCSSQTDWDSIKIDFHNISPAKILADTIQCWDTFATIHVTIRPTPCDPSDSIAYEWQIFDSNTWKAISIEHPNPDTCYAFSSGRYRLKNTLVVHAFPFSQTITIYSNEITIELPTAIQITNNLNDTICYNHNALLEIQVTGGVENKYYTFINTNTNDTAVLHSGNPSYLTDNLIVPTQYLVLVEDECGQSDTGYYSVHVLPQLIASSISVGGNNYICNNTIPPQLVIDASSIGGNPPYSYTLQTADDDGVFMDTLVFDSLTSGDSISFTMPISKTTRFRIESTDATECDTVFSNVITIHVADTVSPAIITGPEIICYNTEAELHTTKSAEGGREDLYNEWQYWNDSIWVLGIAQTDSYRSNELIYDRLFRMVTIDASCNDTAISNIQLVTVLPQLKAPTIESDVDTVCSNLANATNIIVTNPPTGSDGNYNYTWQIWKENSWETITNNTTDILAIPALYDDSNLFRIQIQSIGCQETVYDSVCIHTYPNPDPMNIYGDTYTCRFTNLTYGINTDNRFDSRYQWYVNGGMVVSDTNSSTVSIKWYDTVETYGELMIVRTNNFGCKDTATTLVRFKDIPTTPTIVRKGSSNILIITNFDKSVQYMWGRESKSDNEFSWETNSYSSYPYYQFDKIDTNSYNYVVKAQYGDKKNLDSCFALASWDGNTSAVTQSYNQTLLNIAPNPTANFFDYSVNQDFNDGIRVRIFNSVGEIVYDHSINEYKADTPIRVNTNFAPGIYTIFVQTTESTVTSKVIVQ